jgi:hypothetical protein
MLLKCQSLAAIRAPSIDSINIYKQAVIWGSILSWKMWCCMGRLKLFLQLMGDARISKQLLQSSPIFVLVCP